MATVWIHDGNEPFGGGNFNLLIHTAYAENNYIEQGILEETFIHEAAHTSIDSFHQENPAWKLAQDLDGAFLSDYARDFPVREDMAETMAMYLAVRFRQERISEDLYNQIVNTIPNRIRYLDCLNFSMDIL